MRTMRRKNPGVSITIYDDKIILKTDIFVRVEGDICFSFR